MILIVCGSHQADSQSLKASNYLKRVLENKGEQAEVVELYQTAKKLWANPGDPEPSWDGIKEQAKKCEAFVIVTPEYHGMAAPAIKNFFLFIGGALTAHKPAMIATVSSGRGGSYPIVELRGSSYKNSRICYIPENLILNGIKEILNDPDPISNDEQMLVERIRYNLDVLLEYRNAFKEIRKSAVIDLERYPNGI